jgi:hypothetical protein
VAVVVVLTMVGTVVMVVSIKIHKVACVFIIHGPFKFFSSSLPCLANALESRQLLRLLSICGSL